MKIETSGIILSVRPLGDSGAVVRALSRDRGVVCGFSYGATGRKTKSRPMPGMFGRISWRARLDTEMGSLSFETESNPAAASNGRTATMVCSALELSDAFLADGEINPAAYDILEKFLNNLSLVTNHLSLYIEWEISFLSCLGFAMDLSKCAMCGTTENLSFISPKTGRAACDKCGGQFSDKLFPFPPSLESMMFFLRRASAEMDIKSLPASRMILN